VPEGDTIFRTASTLHRALAGQTVTQFETVLPRLARVEVDTPVTGRTVERVEAHGKWIAMHFSGDLILLTHMLMSGSWHIYRPGERWQRARLHMRAVIHAQRILAVAFSVQVAEFHTAASLQRREGFRSLGQSLLASEFDEAEAVARLRSHPELEIGVALMRQSLLAGVGNVFKSEICFTCRVHPFRLVRSLSGAELAVLVATAHRLLQVNVADLSGESLGAHGGFRRTTGRLNPDERLWVYDRAGEPCRCCGATIESYRQGTDARTAFWCPCCQPAQAMATPAR
jgi:endonuclease VIII